MTGNEGLLYMVYSKVFFYILSQCISQDYQAGYEYIYVNSLTEHKKVYQVSIHIFVVENFFFTF